MPGWPQVQLAAAKTLFFEALPSPSAPRKHQGIQAPKLCQIHRQNIYQLLANIKPSSIHKSVGCKIARHFWYSKVESIKRKTALSTPWTNGFKKWQNWKRTPHPKVWQVANSARKIIHNSVAPKKTGGRRSKQDGITYDDNGWWMMMNDEWRWWCIVADVWLM